MDKKSAKRTKLTCYFTYLSAASIFSLPPLLFATFREMYGISYTLLGTLVLVNFCTQLGIDLILSFFSKYFNIHKLIRTMPLITALGLCIYAVIPSFLPQYAYIGLVIGTFIFSVSAGLGEVLISPTVAALPSDNPEGDMSALHSLYGYGFVSVVVLSTLFLQFVGKQYWMYLTLLWAVLPVIASILYFRCELPPMNMDNTEIKTAKTKHRTKSLLLCMGCIFLGSAAENTMSNWISVYTEKALRMPKVWGDIFGMALFAIVLALTRTLYAKYGKNIHRVLTLGMLLAAVCYIVIFATNNVAISLIACVLVGVFTSMLWPGTLIFMEEKVSAVGVAAYALMAAGGDFGAAFAPQTLGVIVDEISASNWAGEIANALSLTAEQVGFKVGMLCAAVFPICGVILLIYMKKFFSKLNNDK